MFVQRDCNQQNRTSCYNRQQRQSASLFDRDRDRGQMPFAVARPSAPTVSVFASAAYGRVERTATGNSSGRKPLAELNGTSRHRRMGMPCPYAEPLMFNFAVIEPTIDVQFERVKHNDAAKVDGHQMVVNSFDDENYPWNRRKLLHPLERAEDVVAPA